MKRPRPKGPYRLFFLLVMLPMFCVFPYLRGVNNPNEFVRVFTDMAIVEHGTFCIDEQIELWGWTNDMAHVPSKVDGVPHYFMVKAPGIVYAGVPGYFLFSKVVAPLLGHHYPTKATPQEERLWWLRMSTWSLRLTTSQLPCFLFLLWFERYLRAFSKDPILRYVAVAACGLGTNFLAYANMFASHAQYAAVAFLAFAITERALRTAPHDARARSWRDALVAGFCTSMCVTFEYHALFIAVVLTVFGLRVFWRPTRLLAFAVGGLVNVPPMMYFHWRAYGNPLTPGHQLLETASFAKAHQTGLFGVVWPSWDTLRSLAVDTGFGFFGMSPFMWLGLVAVPLLLLFPYGPGSMRRSLRVATLVWGLCALALFSVNAGIVEWRGGWTIGPRYLAACPPFFAFGALTFLERLSTSGRLSRALARGLGAGLCLASILTIGTLSLVYDTLPTNIEKPFAQFTLPLMRTGFVAHHVGEWFGFGGTTFWYVVCAATVTVALLCGFWPARDGRRGYALRVATFVVMATVGMVPALTKPNDGTELFVLHPETRPLLAQWEPPGRDRITLQREAAERFGPRRPCAWHKLADLERTVGREYEARADEKRAGSTSPEQCPNMRGIRRFF